MEHHFTVEIAEKYGILEAVILNHMHFWVTKNEANEANEHDGHYWTYNSVKALNKLFPYASTKKIRNALKRLESEGLIMTGNYNKSAYDRTMWYTLTEKGKCILTKGQMEVTKRENGDTEKGKPIPYNNTDNITDNIVEIIQYLNEAAGTRYKSTSKVTRGVIKARLDEKFTVDDFKVVIDKKVSQWKGTKMEEYLRPQTLFGTKFESYLNQNIVKEEPKPRTNEPPKYKEFEPEPERDTVPMPQNMRKQYIRERRNR